MKNKEVRYLPAEEIRLEEVEGQAPKVVGYGAVFNSFSEDLGGFREIIRPGAFARCLANTPDVRFLLNHEDLPLARTKSGTLRVMEDQRGLRFEASLDPDDPDVKRLMPKMKRGDLSNCSFAFNAISDSWRTENGQDVRELRDVDLFDVSVVTYPAYPAAEAGLRSYRSWKEQSEEQGKPVPAVTPNDVLLLLLDLAAVE